ncbi:copine-8-like protein [Ochromonadaceae sp. CCMP2298]|nr:copine-8-like protein [Ochromonadaceae sp. CCMP2298]
MPIDTACMEKVDIFLSARDLAQTQMMSKTDAFAVLYRKNTRSSELERVGTTPVIKDTANPDWSTGFTVNYMFEVAQEITVQVYQWSDGKPLDNLSVHTLLGEATFRLANLVTATNQKLSPSLVNGKNKGSLEIRAESQTNTRDLFCVAFSGVKLANKDGFFGTSDPFLVVSRMNEDGAQTVVWKSGKIDNSLSPIYAQVKIPMTSLCNGDIYRPLKIEIFDWDSNGKHDSMGCVDTSVNEMLTSGGEPMPVIEESKQSKKNYKNSGHLKAVASIEHRPTFTDFIAGGCEISLITAIDFTGSNGDPAMPESLHYLQGQPNPYQSMLSSVGRILEVYDTDKMYPVFGFGAKVRKPDGSMSVCEHCFPVGEGEAQGVDGILDAYKEAVPALFFSGPTLFQPLIDASSKIVSDYNCTQEAQKYTILLIITDGSINDMNATKAAIIKASALPMSVIIVGVGSDDFSSMRDLDKDDTLMTHGGKTAERDIVQFVARGNLGFAELTEQVLAEVPDQLLMYMESRKILPKKV